MEVRSKLAHLVPHWIEHNASHAEQFGEWAGRARAAGLAKVASHLEAAVKLMTAANAEIEHARIGLAHGESDHD